VLFDVWAAEGKRALDTLERHLSSRTYLVAERFTIADIGLYAYVHLADEAGFDLANFPAVSAWLSRVSAQRGVLPIDENPEAPSP
jgi:glutathione S-transferase